MDEHLVVRLVLSPVMLLVGLGLLVTVRAGASGRLRRNLYAGVRTESTLASDEAWLAAHRAARPATDLAALVAAGAAVAVWPTSGADQAAMVAVAGCGLLLVPTLVGARRGVLAARDVGTD